MFKKHIRYILTVVYYHIGNICFVYHMQLDGVSSFWSYHVFKGFFIHLVVKFNTRPRNKSYFFPFFPVFHYCRHQYIILCMRVCVCVYKRQRITFSFSLRFYIHAHTPLNYFTFTTRLQTRNAHANIIFHTKLYTAHGILYRNL